MQRKKIVASASALLGLTLTAHGGVQVTGNACNPDIPSSAYQVVELPSGHFNVSLTQLYAPFGNTFFEIHPTSPGVIIDNVVIDVDGPPAGSPVIVRVLPDCNNPLVKIKSVGSILQTGTGETLLNKVDVEEDIGFVQVEAIGDLFAHRDIVGPIIATTADNPARGINIAWAQRHILGDLVAANGIIRWVTAHTGDIGTLRNPVSIMAKHGVIQADSVVGDIYAYINTRLNGGNGPFKFLRARTFMGALDTAEIVPGNTFDGQLLVDVELAANITIGRSFVPPNFIGLVPAGLTGQIIINADNLPNPVWTASVYFGDPANPDIELTGPGYTESPDLLGGGSIGLVPFALHDESCVPPNGETVSVGSDDRPLQVKLRHYGPVTWKGTAPLTVERQANGDVCEWQLVTNNFVFIPAKGDENSILAVAAPGAPGFEVGYAYRIQSTGQLLCDNVLGAPPVNWAGPYLLWVESAGPAASGADISGPSGVPDGCVDAFDLAELLAEWCSVAGGNPCGTCGP